MAFGHARRQRLQARYFDTDEQALAQAHVVVRVRKEGAAAGHTSRQGAFVQQPGNGWSTTCCCRGRAAGAMPAVDLSRHAGTPLEAKLRDALDLQPSPSRFVPGVRNRRAAQVLDVKSGRSRVEVAFDRGRVAAGERHAALCEVEFELKSGRPQDAVRLAQAWCTRHGLWISPSKSAKGLRLARDGAPAATRWPGRCTWRRRPAFATRWQLWCSTAWTMRAAERQRHRRRQHGPRAGPPVANRAAPVARRAARAGRIGERCQSPMGAAAGRGLSRARCAQGQRIPVPADAAPTRRGGWTHP